MSEMPDQLVDKIIGLQIKFARREQMMTRAKLSNSLGIDEKVLSSYENGQARVPERMLISLAKVLEKTLSYFTETEDNHDTGFQSDYEEGMILLLRLEKAGRIADVINVLRLAASQC